MKLCIISTMYGYKWGGSEELWYKTAKHALSHGVNVLIIKIQSSEVEHEKVLELLNLGAELVLRKDKENPIVKVINKRFYKRVIGNVFNISKYKTEYIDIEGTIRSFNANVILVSSGHTIEFYTDNLIWKSLQKLTDIPTVLLSQYHDEYGHLPFDFQGVYNYLSKINTFYFVSERNKKVFERQLAINLDNAQIIDNPVNLKDKSYIKFPDNNNEFHFACVARLDPSVKGQDILLEILSSEIWKNRPWILNLYGHGEKGEKHLRSLINLYGLENKVFLRGQARDIREIWEKNHIMILCTHGEGTPLSIMEAMICGRTVVSTDVGGNYKCIIDRETGFLADCGSVNSFGRVLEIAWEQKEDWEKLGHNAHEHILNNFDLNPDVTLFKHLNSIS